MKPLDTTTWPDRQCNRCNVIYDAGQLHCPSCRCPEFRVVERAVEVEVEVVKPPRPATQRSLF